MKKCFICDEKTNKDKKGYNAGGIGRCSEISSQTKLKMVMTERIKDTENKFHEAADRLNVLLSGNAYNDAFAVDIYYHKKCYDAFTYSYETVNADVEIKQLEDQLIDSFFKKVEQSVIKDQQALPIG